MPMQSAVTLGSFDVTCLVDGVFEASSDNIIHVGGSAARARAVAALGRPTITIDVNCFLLRHGDDRILVDTGAGTEWGERFGKSASGLAALGVAPSDIGRIILTHLHGDHVLGLFDAEGAPRFPNAEIFLPATDLAFFTDEAAKASLPAARQGAFDIAARVAASFGDKLRPYEQGQLWPGVETMALPGHTPGHHGVVIGDGARRLLIWADALHLSEIQPGDPDIGLLFDLDPAEAARSRRSMLDEAARRGWTVAGSHVTGFATIEALDSGFRFRPL